jgi:hypothetical protein
MRQKKLRRDESFLGIHFDFHAREDCKEMGKTVTPEMIGAIIDAVDPDYMQCDCKGHAGVSSYPTKVGTPVPRFEKDQLRIWRDVTEDRKVALYMHFSGVWESTVVRMYPEWAAVNADNRPDDRMTSCFGPYLDKHLIPQLKELSDEYQVDGVWIDGDCWATVHDYSETAITAFKEATGLDTVPRKPGDPNFFEFTEFCRQAFRDYLTTYVDAMHAHNRDFQVASNWAYSSQMPEPVTIDVDYISGDYSLQDSVNSARYEGRCMQRQGKPWDLMAWAFSCRFGEWNNCTKSIPQLKQESAVVLALGGGFQAYFKQRRDGAIFPWEMKLMGAVAKFARERQEFCHRGKPVPQVALLYSGKAFYKKNTKLFGGGWGNENLIAMRGMLHALLDTQNVVEVCMEHHIEGRMGEYGLIVIPEWDYLEDGFKNELSDYAKAGGSLLLVGAGPAELFAEETGTQLQGESHGEAIRFLEYDGWFAGLRGEYREIATSDGDEIIATHYSENQADGSTGIPAAIVKSYGKGLVGFMPFEAGKQYMRGATPTLRKLTGGMTKRLFPEPVVEVTGSQYVDVTLSRKDEKLMVHLVNTAGPHSDGDVYVYDEVPPIGPLSVEVRVDEEPKTVSLEPGGRMPEYGYENGEVSLTVDRLEIYDIIVIE